MKDPQISNLRIQGLRHTFQQSLKTGEFDYRKRQRAFCDVARKLLWFMVENGKFNSKNLTSLLTIFEVSPKQETVYQKLKEISGENIDFLEEIFSDYKKCGADLGFTAKGRTGISISPKQERQVEDFIRQIFECTTSDEVIDCVKKYDSLRVPHCTDGVYSPWLHYIHPTLCPIANGQTEKLLKYLGIPQTRRGDYPFMVKLLERVKEEIGAEDYGLVDAFIFQIDPDKTYKDGIPKVWLIHYDCCDNDTIFIGDSVSSKLRDYSVFSQYEDMRKAFQKVRGNTDVSVPNAYWKFIREVSEGDIIVKFKNLKIDNEYHHYLYQWGVFNSDLINDVNHINPLQRKVDWKIEELESPIEDELDRNTLFFHGTTDEQAMHIMELLNINDISEIRQNTMYREYIELLKSNHNLVLTGAPGTGKTYMAKEIAKQLNEDYTLVQFHPSYDYTDFVEGLRPIDNGGGQVGFKRKDGVFKTFCKKAIIEKENTPSINLNDDPRIWKVSLEGTYDNPTRTDCLQNGYIRIGWGAYGDVEDFREHTDYPDGGKSILRAFQSEMKIGDIIVSCYSADETDAIGIVTGDYEYRPEGGAYPRYRTVKWLLKNVRLNISELLGKKMTLSTVYKLNLSVSQVLSLLKENGGLTEHKSEEKPYVFIIDEINRGELSKIFGELFYSIDPGYRGVIGKVKTQYQNLVEEGDVFADGFYVPENVYILATMNDIDRSVESMDFALRRRFTWKEVTPNDTKSMLDSLGNPFADDAKYTMECLNKVISETEGLGEAYQIGPSYFLKLKEYQGNFDKLWDLNILPLLKEYLRGFRNSSEILEKLRDAYFNGEKSVLDVPENEDTIDEED